MKTGLLIIGIGNRDRGDDAIGPLIAEKLAKNPKLKRLGVHVTVHNGEGASLMELWRGSRKTVIIDAMKSEVTAGKVRRFDVAKEKLSGGTFRYSSHLFSLAEAVELARALKRLPDSLVIYGIEGRDFSFGAKLSRPVASAMGDVEVKVAREFLSANPSLRDKSAQNASANPPLSDKKRAKRVRKPGVKGQKHA